jgi:hypothetical protein
MSTSPLVLLDFDGVVAPYDDPRSIPNTWPDWCLSGEGHWLSHSMLDQLEQLGQIIWLSTQGAKPNRWCSMSGGRDAYRLSGRDGTARKL